MPIDPRRVLTNTAHWTDTIGTRVLDDRVPVIVTVRFKDGRTLTGRGRASAVSPSAVMVYVRHPDPAIGGDGYRVWMHRADVAFEPDFYFVDQELDDAD